MSQFYSVLAANRPGFTAKSRGAQRGVIRRGGKTPVEVVHNILTGDRARSQSGAATVLFSGERRRMLAVSAAEAPSLLYLYRRAFASTWKSSGRAEATKIEDEWRAIVSVRGQMLKALGLKDTLRGDDRLPVHLLIKKEEV
jgi:hypothetical protein